MARNLIVRLSVTMTAIALALGIAPALALGDDASDSGSGDLAPGITTPVEQPTVTIISLDGATVTVADQTYTGSTLEPVPTVKLNNETVAPENYDVSYADNVNAGTATVTVNGKGSYTGSAQARFKVKPAAIASLRLSFTSSPYNGTSKSPKATVFSSASKLKAGTDYKITVPKKRIAAGKYVYKAKGRGNYTGIKTATLKIKKTPLSKCSIGKVAQRAYTGSAIRPSVNVKFQGKTLKAGRDFFLTYANNTNCGIAKVKITGKGSCTGSKLLSFTIKPASIANAAVANVHGRTYNGTAQTQSPIVRVNGKLLKQGRDYALHYRNNVNAGTASLIIKGQGSYTGQAARAFRIGRAWISKAKIGPIGKYEETGGAIKPSPTVTMYGRTLVRGRDYTLSYEDNYYSGTATVEFAGRGNYQGWTSRTFAIVEPVLQTVYITRTGECYHRDWCSSLRRSKFAISRSDAIAQGYRACRICRP